MLEEKNNPRYGKQCSTETKEKIRNSLIGKMSGQNNPMYGVSRKGIETKRYKGVNQYDLNMNFIAFYPSITIASEKTNSTRQKISLCCNRKAKTCNGYIWRYAERG